MVKSLEEVIEARDEEIMKLTRRLEQITEDLDVSTRRLRRRRRPQGRLPLHRWTSPPPGCDGRDGTEGRLRRGRGPVQEGYPHPEVPRRARNHPKLGRHGEDLAPHLLQRAPRCPRGAARPPD